MPLHTFERICMRYVAGRRGNRAETASGSGEERVAKGEETSKRVLQVGVREKGCREGAVKKLLQWARPIFIENRCTLKGSTVLATCQLSAHTRTHEHTERGSNMRVSRGAYLLAGNVEMWAMRAVNYQT